MSFLLWLFGIKVKVDELGRELTLELTVTGISPWPHAHEPHQFTLLCFRKQNTLDLLGRDSLVLSRLVYTLGVVIHAAVNTPVSTCGSACLWLCTFQGTHFTCPLFIFSMIK